MKSFHFSLYFLFLVLYLSSSQPTPPSPPPEKDLAPAPAPSSDLCNGIFLAYTHTETTRIPPNLLISDPKDQPFRFESTLEILNNGLEELKQWRAFVGFEHRARLISASNAVLSDGESFPAEVWNGTVLAGFPTSDLKTAVETAGDLDQMGLRVEFVGVQFGVKPPGVPMPTNISMVNDGFLCPKPTMQGKSRMEVCCVEDPNFKSNATTDEEFLPRRSGDLTMMYDVLRTYDSSYWAQVTIENHNPLGRLDSWHLSWDWMSGEFINNMIGAYPSIVDSSDCIFGEQGQHYANLDFSTVLNCLRRPTIEDLPLTRFNDTKLGLKPYCCRNGTILPPQMDSGKSSISSFQLEVFKMPPNLNRSVLVPPQNWRIVGTKVNPSYECGPPTRVGSSESPHSSGVEVNSTAVASWQVVCNMTRSTTRKCCVSFSAFYNDSVVPCGTCACGCGGSEERSCSASAEALLLPAEALLVPFANRTAKTLAWAAIKKTPVPTPMPCPDNCGVTLNWHLVSDYAKGWSARVTLFNWGDENYADWFAAAEMGKAVMGFEKMYSFNGTAIAADGFGFNDTLFMEGLPGLNYLVAEADGANPLRDPRIPGKQQSVISFTKKQTPGINVVAGDGFPTKVYFNGEECAIPSVLPTNRAVTTVGPVSWGLLFLAPFLFVGLL